MLCYLSVSNTINIITYTDVWHDWRGRGGAEGVEGLLGRMGFEGRRVDTALEHEICITLTIGHNVKDRTKKCVMFLFTFLDPPPSWKNNAMSLFTFLDPPPSWQIYVMSLFPVYWKWLKSWIEQPYQKATPDPHLCLWHVGRRRGLPWSLLQED